MTPERAETRRISQTIFIVAVAWAVAAIGLVASGALAHLPRPALQVIIALLTLGALAALLFWPRGCWWVRRVEPRGLVVFHLVRFIGIYFLWLHAHDRLPFAFAVPGGWGDIAIATWAAALLFTPMGRGKAALALWNSAGLIDIIFVVATAARLGLRDPESMSELTHLPLGLLPTFIVPTIIATHILLFMRLAAKPERPGAAVRPIQLETA